MIAPPFLKSGDTIAIVAPARKISPQELEPAINMFESWGLKVLLGEHVYAIDNQFAGSDDMRRLDFQKMLDDSNVKAIIAARGGYGCVRIIDDLNFSAFKANPKWIIGYSDITVFHSHVIKNFKIETLHAVMPINFPQQSYSDQATESLRKALFGEKLQYSFNHNSTLYRIGESIAPVVGGNLSILYNLSGTSSALVTKDKILFIEDLDEYLYHIDRMMMNLKRNGVLSDLKGLIVGGMTDMKDNVVPFGRSAEEIIMDAVKDYDYPVCFNFQAGHIKNNLALFIGKEARLQVTEAKISLEYQ